MNLLIIRMYKKYFIVLILVVSVLFSGCHIYSFTGASYGDAKTVSIAYFENRATYVNPSLSRTFTEKLKDRFVSQTPLALVAKGGDLVFEGEIVDYMITPVNILAGETAASNRLTITVKVRFTNETAPDNDFEKTFSRYADYPMAQNLSSIEAGLVEEISILLIDDIFNDSVVNW